jgi:DNA mismatch repair protein MSH6
VEKASVAGQMMRSKIARNFKSREERAEFSTHREEWLRTVIYVCGIRRGNYRCHFTSVVYGGATIDDDTIDTVFCISQELRAQFRKAR